MLFFKPKQKSSEFLPPPPPFPTLDIEEAPKKSDFFDETLESEKPETFPEQDEFSDLVKDLEKVPQKTEKRVKISLKKDMVLTQKIAKLKSKQEKSKKAISKLKTKKEENLSDKVPDIEEDIGLEELDYLLPKPQAKEDTVFPESLDEIDMGDLDKLNDIGKGFGDIQTQKPHEIVESEQEIRDAIEKIKSFEKPSFFKKLFFLKPKIEEIPDVKPLDFEFKEKIVEPAESEQQIKVNEVDIINDVISKAREALMKFDLDTARREYLEAMKIYNTLAPEDQAKVYYGIKELYHERKSAEGLKA